MRLSLGCVRFLTDELEHKLIKFGGNPLILPWLHAYVDSW